VLILSELFKYTGITAKGTAFGKPNFYGFFRPAIVAEVMTGRGYATADPATLLWAGVCLM
jgi:hypothetical protein